MLAIENLTKIYPSRPGTARPANAINGISFQVAEGKFFTLLGPSGCGKTTTLQCIAGLETPTSGRIVIGGTTVFCARERILVPSNRRDLGMIFQSYAIWPHMSVFDNVAFPLVHGGRRVPAGEVRRRVMEALALVKLADFAARPSPHLSGGQQQRVALARALVHRPRLLLLDEPLSNLDASLRDTMRVELRQLVTSLGITTVFVTHDQVEAMAMSDDILLMRAGNVVQQGAPRDMFLRPASVFAADFMGRSNILPGRLAARGATGDSAVATALGLIACTPPPGLSPGADVCVVIRPRCVFAVEGDAPAGPDSNVFSGTVAQAQFIGDAVETEVDVAGTRLRAMLDPYRPWRAGDAIRVALPPARCVVVPAEQSSGAGHAAAPPVQARSPLMAVA